MLSVYSWVLLFLVSPDSYMHDLWLHNDSAIFFMCGKAWMNGMVPYVDFTDSKGPLLWLIYGIGYKISNLDYTGVFWLSWLLYSWVFFFVYKIADLFIKDKRLSVLCAVMMGLSFFNPWYHFEVRAEDWCQPFIVYATYQMCRILYTNERHDKCSVYGVSYALGFCLAGVLMIKYSITLMMGSYVLFLLYYLLRERISPLIPCFFLLLGFATLLLPFLIYFLLFADLSVFVDEYFLNTFLTVKGSDTFANYLHEVLIVIADPTYAVLFFVTLVGVVLWFRDLNKYSAFPLLVAVVFWAVSLHHAFYYYFASCLLFSVWFLIWVMVEKRAYFQRNLYTLSLASFLGCVFLNYVSCIGYTGYLTPSLFFYDNENRQSYWRTVYVLSQVEHPKVMFYGNVYDYGYATPVNGLPATRYYHTQNGMTPPMLKKQEEAVVNRVSDFVFVADGKENTNHCCQVLNSAGYSECFVTYRRKICLRVFTKHAGLKLPTADFHVGNVDVLLKRKIVQ